MHLPHPFIFLLRPEALDYARERLAQERPVARSSTTFGRALYELARDPNTRAEQVTTLLAGLPGAALLSEARTPPRVVRRPASITDVAQALSVSRDLLYANVRGKPLSVRMRQRILTCPAFARLSEDQLWERRARADASTDDERAAS